METVADWTEETFSDLTVETVTGVAGVSGIGLRLAVEHISLKDWSDSVSSSVIWGRVSIRMMKYKEY